MPFDKFDKLEESIEKYSTVCIDKDNNVVVNDECNRLLLVIYSEICCQKVVIVFCQ